MPILFLFITSICMGQSQIETINPVKEVYQIKIDSISKLSKLKVGDYTEVYSQFGINDKGNIIELKVRGFDIFCENRAISIINELPEVSPNFVQSRNNKSKYVMLIKFKVIE